MILTEAQLARARDAAHRVNKSDLLSIRAMICREMGVKEKDVLEHGRGDQKVMAARVQIALCMREHGASYPAIGKAMARDHTTIMHMLGVLGRLRGNAVEKHRKDVLE